MFSPTEYTGALMDLGQTRRGIYIEQKYLTPERSTLIYEVPLAEVITDFFDQLKSRTKGYASMSFTEIGFREDALGNQPTPLCCHHKSLFIHTYPL